MIKRIKLSFDLLKPDNSTRVKNRLYQNGPLLAQIWAKLVTCVSRISISSANLRILNSLKRFNKTVRNQRKYFQYLKQTYLQKIKNILRIYN